MARYEYPLDVIEQQDGPRIINPEEYVSAQEVLAALDAREAAIKRKRLLDSGNVGSTVDIVPTLSRSISALRVEGDDNHPDYVMVMAQIIKKQAGGTLGRPDLFLDVRWGVKNFQLNAEVDLNQGCMFSLTASFLEILVKNGVNGPNSTYTVGVTVGYGIRAAHAPPTRTKHGDAAVAAGATGATVTVPNFARGVTPIINSTTGSTYSADVVVRQKDDLGTILSEHPYVFSGAPYLSPARIPLHNDCVTLDIANVDTTNTVEMKYIFDLAF